MIQRPTKDDSEKDVLRMQREFLQEKRKNQKFQPAAQVVRVKTSKDDEGIIFLHIFFSFNYLPNMRFCYCIVTAPEQRKQSEFAKRRNIKRKDEQQSVPVIVGDIVARTYSDEAYFFEESMETDETPSTSQYSSFPEPLKIDLTETSTDGRSLFSKTWAKQNRLKSENINKRHNLEQTTSNLPDKSTILEGREADDIHTENVKKLKQMSQEEILKEREELMKNMDPSLIEFLKSRREAAATSSTSVPMETQPSTRPAVDPEKFPALSILKTEEAKNWLHFDVLEYEKLEWTKDIDESLNSIKPGEKYEARFDWKGVLLPFKENQSSTDNRELYMHGEEPHRPGYTLQELFRLARATVLQQRVAALNSIAGILNIYNQGFYDGILELPITKIFFFLRFALDENTPAIIEAASKSLAYLFYNDSDEILLDTIFESFSGLRQPALQRNKTSTQSLSSSDLEDEFDNLSLNYQQKPFESTVDDDEFKRDTITDYHLAEIDLVECLLRTNILERIRYILFTIRPEEATVTACLKLLIRVARTNKEAAMKVLLIDGLVTELIQSYFTSIEDSFSRNMQPNYLAMKLLRVLAESDITAVIRLQEIGVLEIAKSYVFSRRDIDVSSINFENRAQ